MRKRLFQASAGTFFSTMLKVHKGPSFLRTKTGAFHKDGMWGRGGSGLCRTAVLFPQHRGRDAHGALEHSGEVVDILKTGGKGNGSDGIIGRYNQVYGLLYSYKIDIIQKSLADILLKNFTDIVLVDVQQLHKVVQLDPLGVMLIDILQDDVYALAGQ